jgi:hypothetical protein
MYCHYCGMQLDDSALYCGRCGQSTQPVSRPASNAALPPVPALTQTVVLSPIPPQNPVRILAGQVRLLGILWALYSAFRLMISTGGMLFGRAMMRMSIHTWPPDNIDPYPFIRFMRAIFFFSGVVSFLTGVLGILAAILLLRRDRSGRTIVIVVAFLALISFPFGTALGIYTLIVLLREGSSENYEHLSVPSA